jgi:hypothetical protein
VWERVSSLWSHPRIRICTVDRQDARRVELQGYQLSAYTIESSVLTKNFFVALKLVLNINEIVEGVCARKRSSKLLERSRDAYRVSGDTCVQFFKVGVHSHNDLALQYIGRILRKMIRDCNPQCGCSFSTTILPSIQEGAIELLHAVSLISKWRGTNAYPMTVRVDKHEHIFLTINRLFFLPWSLRIRRNRLLQSHILGKQLFIAHSAVCECLLTFLRGHLQSVSACFNANSRDAPRDLHEQSSHSSLSH